MTRHDAAEPGRPERLLTTTPGTPGVTLRAMTRADLPAVLRLEAALFGDEAWSEAMLPSELDRAQASGRYYLVAEDAGGLVGYAGLLSPGGGQADVLTMAVAEDRWGQRIGASAAGQPGRRGGPAGLHRGLPRGPGGQRPRPAAVPRPRVRRRSASGAATTSRPGTDALVMQLSLPRPGARRRPSPPARGPRPRRAMAAAAAPR